MSTAEVRARAARNVAAVLAGHSLDEVLLGADALEDQALVAELSIGTVRHWYSLTNAIAALLAHPLKDKDTIVLALLAVGAYQLRHTRIPPHAAVNETVAAARRVGRPWAKALVNGVLRKLTAGPWPEPTNEAAQFDHPSWLIARLRAAHPDRWRAMLATSLTRAPLTLRVNLRRGERSAVMAILDRAGIRCTAGTAPTAVVIDKPRPSATLPGFADGRFSVQDEGAQWVTAVLGARPGERVLDACAAPGGKTLACLEAADVELTALDIDHDRLARITNEALRLGLDPPTLISADATQLDWWDGRPFDRVLIDAPCSGTGTLRRHPDIKLLKRESDVDQYRAIQSTLARTLSAVVKPGGTLVYCTCSILDEENDEVIGALLEAKPELHIDAIDAPFGRATRYGRLIEPTAGGADGFYYARLVRTSPIRGVHGA